MRRIEDNCVCCDLPCINCGRREEEVIYCDCCNKQLEQFVQYEDSEFCFECAVQKVIEDFVINVSKTEALENIRTIYGEYIIKENDGLYYLFSDSNGYTYGYTYNEAIDNIVSYIKEDINSMDDLKYVLDALKINYSFV